MRCPKCGTNNPPEEQLTYCRTCGTELRVVCPRCHADNPGYEEYCHECGLELHPNRGHERAAGIRRDDTVTISGEAVKKRISWTTLAAVGIGVLFVAWLPAFTVMRQRAQFNNCQSNIRQVALALRLYASDNDDVLLNADDWSERLLPYLKDARYMQCPSRNDAWGYGYNLGLSDRPLGNLVPGSTIAFFEVTGDKSVAGGSGNWMTPPAHSRGNNVVFLDGKVHVYKEAPPVHFWSGVSTDDTPEPTPTPASKNAKPGDKNAPHGTAGTAPDAAPTGQGTAPNTAQGNSAEAKPTEGNSGSANAASDSAANDGGAASGEPTATPMPTPAPGMPALAPAPPPPTAPGQSGDRTSGTP